MTQAATWLRRAVKLVVAVTGVALAAGMTWQGVSTALERRDFPPPGARVSVGDHQLHLFCQGDGLPLVILEAPEAGGSSAWGRVQPAIAARTRVCSYDRSGLGWSEASSMTFDPDRVAGELHALLEAATVRRPVVLVGQSLGAWYARLYARQYPQDVTALVLVDEPDPSDAATAQPPQLPLSPWLARTGALRLTGHGTAETAGLPGASGGAMRAFLFRPDHLTRAVREVARWQETAALVRSAPTDPALRVLAVATGDHAPGTFPSSAAAEQAITRAVFEALGSATP
ncbi:MAG: alpha/beta fold hydrolase [Vicinamibacterales bacterium]